MAGTRRVTLVHYFHCQDPRPNPSTATLWVVDGDVTGENTFEPEEDPRAISLWGPADAASVNRLRYKLKEVFERFGFDVRTADLTDD